MRIPSGSVVKYANFVAVDETDGKTRETGISSWTIYRSRNGGTSTLWTTPTVVELSAANQPGEYALLVDEDTTLSAGQDDDEMIISIKAAGVLRATRVVEIYRPKGTLGETLTIASGIGQAAVQSIVANAVNASALATDAVTEIVSAVWAATTRILTAGTNIVLAKGVGITGLNDLSAAQVNAEADTALADYDAPTNAEMVARTIVAANYATAANLAVVDGVADAIKLKTDNLPSDPADQSLIIDATNTILTAVADVPNNAEFNAATDALSVQIAAIGTSVGGLPSNSSIANAVMNATVEGAYSLKQTLRLQSSALFGKVDGGQLANPIQFYDITGTKVRISGDGDQYGNRSAPITLDADDA